MPDHLTPRPETAPALQSLRQRTIDELCRQFAADNLDLVEFERRLDLAHRVGTATELAALTSDLPAADAPEPAAAEAPRARPAAGLARRGRQALLAILGGTTRRGRWTPAEKSTVVAIMGGAQIDFREALLPPGETEVQCFAFWGGIEIIVPPDLVVDVDGVAILGGFEHSAAGAADPPPDAPRLRITGAAVMGGVEIKVRALAESGDRTIAKRGYDGPRSAFEEIRRWRDDLREQLREDRRELRRQLRGSVRGR
ncbi:MAG: DUF1707 and DUF2154 domain-containing protein [Gemmatimonadetes bacterium]|nr:DUF1707 and DUF2154 domain-containing protein [Gemmatimonadota bacterium]